MTKKFDFAHTSDVDEFEAGCRAFREGRMSEERFTPFRLQMGIYGQRQDGVQMVRVKLPGGCITPDQLEVIAGCVEDYAGRLPTDGTLHENPPKLAHITTRQDIQTHFVSLDDVPAFLRRLDAAGLTTREACGNTVRNVTSCFLSGRCPAEYADASVHARIFAEYFLRHPLTQQFPRKFKVSFSGCATDCALSGIQDIGFIACENSGRRGFQVWAAGGLSTQPMGAILLEDFIEEREMLVVGEALMRLHFRYSDRKVRTRARMKYVARKLGREGFIEEYRKQRAAIERIHTGDSGCDEAGWRQPTAARPFSDSGVVDQHNGGKAVLLNLFRGDLTPEQCRALAEAARLGGTTELRATAEQGMVLMDVAPDRADAVLERLGEADLASEYARGIADIVACPGSETCRLGITSSRGLAEALEPLLIDLKQDRTLSHLTVKASGCQHSCAQHHIADLGFHGMAKKISGQAVPHYQLHIGGSGVAGSALAFATDPVPAKHAPEAGMAVLHAYRDGRLVDESMHDWAERLGREGIAGILRPFGADEGEVEGLIYDWNENEAFNTKGNKKGECAGAVLSMSDALLAEAEYELLLAAAFTEGSAWAEAQSALRRSVLSTARAFLVPFGEAPEDDFEVFGLLSRHAGGDADAMNGFQSVQSALMLIDPADPAQGISRLQEAQSRWLALALKRFAAVPADDMAGKEPAAAAGSETAAADVARLDLSGVACPMNFVKTKIRLASMEVGSRLEVILDDGEPIENVPLSLEEQGQTVHAKERISDGQWKIVVEKSSGI